MMRLVKAGLLLAVVSLAIPGSVSARDDLSVTRLDTTHVRLSWTGRNPATVRILASPDGRNDRRAAAITVPGGSTEVVLPVSQGHRPYLLARDSSGGKATLVAERLLPLERGSNFRDLGGYAGAGGKRVVWGRLYRSGALPMLSETDYTLLGKLDIRTIVGLRSLDERQIAPDLLDDRTGALFVSNDYAMAPLLESMRKNTGEPLYKGTEKRLLPQFRSLFQILLGNKGATMFHCSAGQDRTGIASALVLTALGVDRETIIRDYHLSTASRRPQFEMPRIDPVRFPGNAIAAIYAAGQNRPEGMVAEPLFTRDGRSHLAMFLDYVDAAYGSVPQYLKSELGIGDAEVKRLRELYLQ